MDEVNAPPGAPEIREGHADGSEASGTGDHLVLSTEPASRHQDIPLMPKTAYITHLAFQGLTI